MNTDKNIKLKITIDRYRSANLSKFGCFKTMAIIATKIDTKSSKLNRVNEFIVEMILDNEYYQSTLRVHLCQLSL